MIIFLCECTRLCFDARWFSGSIVLDHCYERASMNGWVLPGASILAGRCRNPQILGRRGRGLVVKYYSLSYIGSMFESGDF